MAMIDDQFVRCQAAVDRLQELMPDDATGETTLPIAVHEVHDLEVFFVNVRHIINVARNLGEIRLELIDQLNLATAVLERHPSVMEEYTRYMEARKRERTARGSE